MTTKQSLLAVFAAALLGLPMVANANYNNSCNTTTTGTGSTCPTFSFESGSTTSTGGVVATATAYYNTYGSGSLQTSSSTAITGPWPGSGIGVQSTYYDDVKYNPTYAEHAIDNDGNYDWVMISFGDQKLALDQITLGWIYNDADMTILASNTMSTNLADWTYIEDIKYSGGSTTNDVSFQLTNDAFCASYWLIGAINPTTAPQGTPTSGRNIDANKDYFKLLSVAACANCSSGQPNTGVPEPGSLALAGLGLLGVLGMRRRRA